MSPQPTRVFVSPHPDDIAYSCFASLVDPSADLARTLIVTVFGSSIRARGPLGLHGSAEEISTLRRREDRDFAATAQCTLLSLQFPDSSLRYKEWVAFGNLDSRSESIFAEVKESLSCVIKALPTDATVFVPLGIGSHIDHCVVRDAVIDLVCKQSESGKRMRLVYFEDLPYAAKIADEQIESFVRGSISPFLRPKLVSLDSLWSRKTAAVEMYESQLKPEVLPAISQHSLRIGCQTTRAERLWVDDINPNNKNLIHMPESPGAVLGTERKEIAKVTSWEIHLEVEAIAR